MWSPRRQQPSILYGGRNLNILSMGEAFTRLNTRFHLYRKFSIAIYICNSCCVSIHLLGQLLSQSRSSIYGGLGLSGGILYQLTTMTSSINLNIAGCDSNASLPYSI